MWILESRGDFFQGRRMWLKPGKQYLFGRVKNNGVQFALSYKTVSRKHFVISIDEVQDSDVGNTHARSKITIIDQKSKTGTVVNGDLIKDSSRDLTLTENVVRVGGCDEEIIVRWQPCVLTFHLLKKEIRAGALRTKQERVKDLDIKAVSEFISGTTTHLIVNKRNTAKGLQALINGKWLVADSYIDALEYAATPADLDEEEHLSPLEQDFDRAWPDPASHLPPPGKEPTTRSADSYRPNPRRCNMFEFFTFVFGDLAQYENLLPPITAGHGKALLYKVLPNETTSDEMVVYLQNAAGRKGFGDTQKATDKGAVILVRWTDANNSQWVNELINQVALKLDQRAIDQSEFLDAILAVNALTLRQAIPYESDREGLMAPPATAVRRHSATVPSQALATQKLQTQQHNARRVGESLERNIPAVVESESQSRSNNSHDPENMSSSSSEQDVRSVVQSKSASIPSKAGRIIDFDDDFDPDAVVPFEDSDNQGDEAASGSSRPQQASIQNVGQDLSTTNGRHEHAENDNLSSRKRLHHSLSNAQTSFNDDEDDLDDLLPAAAAMKRRKLMDGSHTKSDKAPASAKSTAGIILPAFRTRGVKEIDIKQEMKAKRTAEKNATEAAEDDDTNMIHFDESGNLPVYDVNTELIDVPSRRKAMSEASGSQSDRWDPKWNGRKNFKAFRRARNRSNDADNDDQRDPRARVIVPLVDAPKTTYGIGDQYWDKPEEDKERERARKKRANYRNTQSQNQSSANQASTASGPQSQAIHDNDDEDDDHGHDERLADPSPSVIRLQQEAASIMDHSVDVQEPRRTRADDRQDTETRTQNLTQAQSEPESGRGSKRPATSVGGRGGTASKRQKTLPVTTVHGSDSESEDSDDMKFKFGRGRRARGRA